MTLTVAGGSIEIATAQARLTAFLERHATDPRTILRSELLFEEVVMNAIRHGGAPLVTITATPAGDGVGLLFEDSGPPFDPVAAPLPDTARSLDDERVGGRGLRLMRKMSRSMGYERTPDGRNRLTMLVA